MKRIRQTVGGEAPPSPPSVGSSSVPVVYRIFLFYHKPTQEKKIPVGINIKAAAACNRKYLEQGARHDNQEIEGTSRPPQYIYCRGKEIPIKSYK